mgnify:CR=1 FL=1
MIDINTIPFDDQKTWELIQGGMTCGVFQCESKLVQGWLRKLKPKNIWELSAVISLVRPGCLQSSMTDQYYRNLQNESIESFNHPIIDDVFKTTNGIMIYQETLMSLGAKLAWPHYEEKKRKITVDILRKAVGKKNQQKIMEIGKEFVEGCLHNKVDKEIAERLFEIIKNSGRYLFNLSHSIKYARIAYHTAYLKTHYPLPFYTTYMSYSKLKMKKWQELARLIDEARIFGVPVLPPNINCKNPEFRIENDSIRYGLNHIKYFGGQTQEYLKSYPIINDWRLAMLVCFTDTYAPRLREPTAEALILSGCFRDCNIPRKTLYNIFQLFTKLTNRELDYCLEQLSENQDFIDVKKIPELIQGCINNVCRGKRKLILTDTIKLLNLNEFDHPSWLEENEQQYMGIALSATSVDMSPQDHTGQCINLHGEHYKGEYISINSVIEEIRFTETKKGKNPGQKMAIIKVYDQSGSSPNLPVFPDLFQLSSHLLIEKNTVHLKLSHSNTGWIIEDICAI